MEHIIDFKNWGRIFTVPCSVVDDHIKLSSGNAVKVLLCILGSNSGRVNSENIAHQIGISENEVDDAIAYWQQADVLSVKGSTFTPTKDENIATKVTQQPNIVKTCPEPSIEAINPCVNTLAKKTTVKYSPKDIEKIVNCSTDLKFLMDNAQLILKRPITFTEQGSLINLHEYYGFSVGVILMLFDYCEQIGKTSVGYIEAIARSWFEKEIVTHEAVEKEIIRIIDSKSFENRISSSFGLTTKLTPKQKEFIESWLSLDLSFDLIEFAYEKCVDSTNKLSFPYINKILVTWAENGFKTRKEIELEGSKSKKATANKKEHSYDLDEFYKLALNNTPTFNQK